MHLLKWNANFKVELNEESILVNLYTLEVVYNSQNMVLSVSSHLHLTVIPMKKYHFSKLLLDFLLLKWNHSNVHVKSVDQSDHYNIFISICSYRIWCIMYRIFQNT